jgi:hypothetical protein
VCLDEGSRTGGAAASLEACSARDEERSFEWRTFFVRSFLERDLGMLGIRIEPAEWIASGAWWPTTTVSS